MMYAGWRAEAKGGRRGRRLTTDIVIELCSDCWVALGFRSTDAASSHFAHFFNGPLTHILVFVCELLLLLYISTKIF